MFSNMVVGIFSILLTQRPFEHRFLHFGFAATIARKQWTKREIEHKRQRREEPTAPSRHGHILQQPSFGVTKIVYSICKAIQYRDMLHFLARFDLIEPFGIFGTIYTPEN